MGLRIRHKLISVFLGKFCDDYHTDLDLRMLCRTKMVMLDGAEKLILQINELFMTKDNMCIKRGDLRKCNH